MVESVDVLEGAKRWPGFWSWAGFAVALVFVLAYRGLLSFDPAAGLFASESDLEEFIFSPTGGSPRLILGIVAIVLASRGRVFLHSIGAPTNPSAAGALLLLAFGTASWSQFVGAPDLMLPSLGFALIGVAWLLCGQRGVRWALFPAVFLVFAIPLPPTLTNLLVFKLQMSTASATSWILDLVGYSHRHAGDLLIGNERTFQVIESCSGLRGIQTITMAAALYLYLFPMPLRNAVVLMLLAPVIAYGFNIVRVLTIVFNPYSGFAAIHTAQGLAVIVAAVFSLAVLDRLLVKILPPPPSRDRPTVKTPSRDELRRARLRLIPVVSVLGSIAVLPFMLPAWRAVAERQPALESIPSSFDGWTSKGALRADRSYLGSITSTERVYRRYERDGEEVVLFAASDDRSDRRFSMLSKKTGILEPGRSIIEESRVALSRDGPIATVLTLDSPTGAVLAYQWTTGTDSAAIESARELLGLDQSPLHRSGRALTFTLLTPRADGDQTASRAADRLNRFAAPLLRQLDELGILPDSTRARSDG